MIMQRRSFLKATATTAAAAVANSVAMARDSKEPVRYPDPALVTVDPRFDKYKQGNAAVERLWTGSRWAEGPVWFGDGRYLLFSDIPNNRILRWTEETGEVSVYRQPSNWTNGNTRDKQGRLVSCEHGRRVTRTEPDGAVTVLADRFEGKRFNAPNDVVVHPDGGIWFTDPGYGIMSYYEGEKGEFELPPRTYRIDPASGSITIVATEAERPNGLCFSPDHKKLYLADTGAPAGKPHPIFVYDVVDGKRLANGRIFYDMGKGMADGIRMDIDGNVWASSGWVGEGYDGVQVITPEGTLIGRILLPEICSNLCFGGLHRNRLFMTGSQSLYAVFLNVQGAQFP
jgi:gluconolactonase